MDIIKKPISRKVNEHDVELGQVVDFGDEYFLRVRIQGEEGLRWVSLEDYTVTVTLDSGKALVDLVEASLTVLVPR